MKLRIKGNSIRLRLSVSEVKALAEGNEIVETTYFSPVERFQYVLKTWHLHIIEAHMEKSVLLICASEDRVKSWASSDAVSLEEIQDNSSGGLAILIEKDFACSKDGIDNSDSFPQPTDKKC